MFVTKHMDGYCMWPTDVRNPHRAGWNCRRDVVGELSEAVRGAGMRFGIYYSGGLDSTFNDRPIGSVAEMLDAIPRGDYPAYAEAQVRELIARYRPSVLWNDIAWPAEGKRLWPLFEHYYEQVPDGVVNDRWIPWSPLLAAARSQLVRRAIDAGVRRQAKRDAGVVPPIPPHSDVRTPGVRRVRRRAAQAVGVRAGHGPELRVQRLLAPGALPGRATSCSGCSPTSSPRAATCSSTSVPAASTRRFPTSSSRASTGSVTGSARTRARSPRPGPGSRREPTPPRVSRFATPARDETVYAFVQGATGSITLPDVCATPTTTVTTVDGAARPWNDTPAGIVVDTQLDAADPDPVVLALTCVAARPLASGRR